MLVNRQGHFEEARQEYAELLPLLRESLGEEHPLTLSCIGDLGAVPWQLGRLDEAAQGLEPKLARTREVPSSANALSGLIERLAWCYANLHAADPTAGHDKKSAALVEELGSL